MKVKRIFACLLAAQMMFLATACGENGSNDDEADTSSSSAASEAQMKPVGEFPFANNDITITFGLAKSSFVEDYNTNLYTTNLEAETGINLDFFLFPEKDASQKLEVMVASDTELPDVLLKDVLGGTASVWNYAKSGKLIPLNEYYETSSYYIKERLPEANEEIGTDTLEAIRMFDGNIYTIPEVTPVLSNMYSDKAWMNTKWLEAVGKEMPTTTDELYDVLVAFRDGDPNGNGQKDEIPMVGATGWQQNPWEYLMYAFEFVSPTYLNAENGQLYAPFITDAWRNGLRYINKLVSEELLSPLSFTQDSAQLKAMTDRTEEETIVGFIVAGANMGIFGPENTNKLNYECPAPFIGPDGVQWAGYSPFYPVHFAAITSDCKNPEAAFRLLDATWKEELGVQCRYGEKDVDWKVPDEGVLCGYEEIGINASLEIINETWAVINNKHWNLGGSYLGSKWQDGLAITNELDAETRHKAATRVLMGHKPEEVVGQILYNDEELAQIKDLQNTIQTYMTESAVRFITNDLDIEKDWDNYLKELEKMGLEEYLQISQTAYDRMNKK